MNARTTMSAVLEARLRLSLLLPRSALVCNFFSLIMLASEVKPRIVLEMRKVGMKMALTYL